MLLKAILRKVILLRGFHMQGKLHINAVEVKKTGNLRGGNVRTVNLRGIDAGSTRNPSSESALQIQSEIASTTKTNTGCGGDGIECSTENSSNDLLRDGINTSNDLPKTKNVIINPSEGGNISNKNSEDENSGNTGKNLSKDENIGNDLPESNMKMPLSAVSVQLLEGLDLVERLGLGESKFPSDQYDWCPVIFICTISLLCFCRCFFHCCNCCTMLKDSFNACGKTESNTQHTHYLPCRQVAECMLFTSEVNVTACAEYRTPKFSNDFFIEEYYKPEVFCDRCASFNGFDPAFACQCCCCLDVPVLCMPGLMAPTSKMDTFKLTRWNVLGYGVLVVSYVTMLFSGVYTKSMTEMICCFCPVKSPQNGYPSVMQTPMEIQPEIQPGSVRPLSTWQAWLFWICSLLQIESLLWAGCVTEECNMRLLPWWKHILLFFVMIVWKMYGGMVLIVNLVTNIAVVLIRYFSEKRA